jgi:adenosine deaminase
VRDLRSLPKAHLHLHFTGSMDVETLRTLVMNGGLDLPHELLDAHALDVPSDERGWFRFQRLYEAARRAVRSEAAMRLVIRRAAQLDAADGSRRMEIQVDPSGYVDAVGGIEEALAVVLDEARLAASATGVSIGVIVAASRRRHPLDARTLARLAARHAGEGVIAFGLSNDEREGLTSEWEPAFRIARAAGLPGVPHAGELRGASHVREVVRHLRPTRLGHGVRAASDPRLLAELAEAGIAFEVCPASNVHMGIFEEIGHVPVRTLRRAGVAVALSADDPLLFLSRLTDQYESLRLEAGFSDAELVDLARCSIDASLAPSGEKRRWLAEVDAWLARPAPGA